MLSPKSDPFKLKLVGFLVGIQVEEGVSAELLSEKLSDAVKYVDGVGEVMVEILGEMDSDEGAA